MAGLELLTLDLRSPLAYRSLEESSRSPFNEAELGEGEDELCIFDEEELVVFDADEGPILRRPLPRPRFRGRRLPDGDRPAGEAGPEPAMIVAVGRFVFLQWRPRDEDELREGLEWFAREVWWQRAAVDGPYLFRRLREDGKPAAQVFRRL